MRLVSWGLASSLCIVVSALPLRAQDKSHGYEGGYAVPQSVVRGDTVAFCVSADQATIDLRIYRNGKTHQPLWTIEGVHVSKRTLPDSAYAIGCNWPVSCRWVIPRAWTPGVYSAEFTCKSGTQRIVFTVRAEESGSISPVLIVLASSTWQAYNNFGGKSLYDFNSSWHHAASSVSFNRPLAAGWDEGVPQPVDPADQRGLG